MVVTAGLAQPYGKLDEIDLAAAVESIRKRFGRSGLRDRIILSPTGTPTVEVKNLTTDVKPLSLLPAGACVSQQEASRQLQYTRAFKSAMAKEMRNFLHIPAAMLNMGKLEFTASQWGT